MSKEKKFVTCDGNQAAAHVAYMFTEVAAMLTNWLPQVERTFSLKQSWFKKCNLKEVLPVLFTVHSKPVHLPPLSPLHRVYCS